jgi:hypothetical protein
LYCQQNIELILNKHIYSMIYQIKTKSNRMINDNQKIKQTLYTEKHALCTEQAKYVQREI